MTQQADLADVQSEKMHLPHWITVCAYSHSQQYLSDVKQVSKSPARGDPSCINLGESVRFVTMTTKVTMCDQLH